MGHDFGICQKDAPLLRGLERATNLANSPSP
ncbi:hypothetical protein QF035_006585 [Streptomyces umbrinus]|uniref:Uncharacterized protein n=1 Tax=Streptomyces umbrinus TaxID=67370 RepID=A0ABU0SZY3_9ACTN|nr:hypothetical protein [Streptomyces umbrinus]